MDDSGITFPVFLPMPIICLCPFFGKGDISDGCIHPYIYYKVVMSRKTYSPFKVPSNAPVSKFLFYPSKCIIPCI